ncbi:carbonate dehydratase [Clostridium oryzae]|uniref:Carnitine operon protein CaiE n=1 Tax=Clostridium oryzae TaxID=1450648 RepID=A0A1V4IPV7_9CLOT|nr:carbonate dehydratase [Clostridium oryzae]OPJ61943.1 carnitine operon protein CaiE [Clostridium oryzae]
MENIDYNNKNSSKELKKHIGMNPITTFSKESIKPSIEDTVFVGPFSSIIGDVRIQKNVFVASNVNIRADEGTPFYIEENTNIQDGVTMHGLKDETISVDGEKFSIYIGKNVSCAHGCIIHGPCKIEDNVFVGFNAIVLNAVIGSNSYIGHNALVTGGVKVASNKFVPAGAIIDSQEKANNLSDVSSEQKKFAKDVQNVNKEFSASYLQSMKA